MHRRLLAVLLSLMLSAPPLIAQSYEVGDAYSGLKAAPEKSVAKEWLIGSVFLVGCLVVAFKPAKRANLR